MIKFSSSTQHNNTIHRIYHLSELSKIMNIPHAILSFTPHSFMFNASPKDMSIFEKIQKTHTKKKKLINSSFYFMILDPKKNGEQNILMFPQIDSNFSKIKLQSFQFKKKLRSETA